MSDVKKSLSDMLISCSITVCENLIKQAAFDKSSVGMVVAIEDKGHAYAYSVFAFGGTHTITSKLTFSVGQKVAVVAPQNNFNKLYMLAI